MLQIGNRCVFIIEKAKKKKLKYKMRHDNYNMSSIANRIFLL